MMSNTAYLSMGTNIGDRAANLDAAIMLLASNQSIDITKISSIYETDPVGYTDQAMFLNIAVKIKTSYSARELLAICQAIENELGRKREVRWGPRIIDLDILLYNIEKIETEKLIIPHPRLHERAFVLIPLIEVDENIHYPTNKTPLVQLLADLPDRKGVRLWGQINGEGVSVPFAN